MIKWHSVIHENMILTLITCLIFDVAICQLPNTPTSRSLIFRNTGIKLCKIKCIENGFCQSIEYTISTLTCLLSEMDHDTITIDARHFVGSKDLADGRAGSCQLKTCPNMRCMETRTGKAKCVKDERKHTELNLTLSDASTMGDLARVKYILHVADQRPNINSIGKDNMTPVMHAAKGGHRHVFELLVREGANLSLLDRGDRNILHLACIGGNAEIVKYVLTQNIVGVNSRDKDKQTPAMNAALYKRKYVFDLLVEAKADLSLVNTLGQTILHVACNGGNVEIVKNLLKHDIVDIDSRDVDGWTPVMHAVNAEHKDVFDILVEAGANLTLVTDNTQTILHVACGVGNLEIIKYILKHDIVDIDRRDRAGWTPVMRSTSDGDKSVFDVLAEAGADLSQVGNDKESILHLACEGGNLGIVKYLLKHGIVNIDSRNTEGRTPIMEAASDGHKDVFDFLVTVGAVLSPDDNDKETILHVACDGGIVEIVKFLLKHDIVDIDSRDMDGRTPVMRAANAEHKDVFDILVMAGADLSQVSNEERTILHVSCSVGAVEIVKYLLKQEIVDIDSRDVEGWTAVMHAANAGHEDVFDVLVKAGADLSQVSYNKDTILHTACDGENFEIIKYLLNHDIVAINSRDDSGWTPVMHATLDGSEDVFDLLVKWGADLSLLDDDSNNILHLACGRDSVTIVKRLLKQNIVDINSRDEDDCTPAMIAASKGHETVFFLLVQNEADLTIMNDAGETILNMACKGGNEDIVKYVRTVKGPYRKDESC